LEFYIFLPNFFLALLAFLALEILFLLYRTFFVIANFAFCFPNVFYIFFGTRNFAFCFPDIFCYWEFYILSQSFFGIVNFVFNSSKTCLELEILHFACQTFLEIVNFACQTYFGIDNFSFFFPNFFRTVNFAFCSANVCLK
jgi:hypothetical protein